MDETDKLELMEHTDDNKTATQEEAVVESKEVNSIDANSQEQSTEKDAGIHNSHNLKSKVKGFVSINTNVFPVLCIQVVVYCLLLAKLGVILHWATNGRMEFLFVWGKCVWIDISVFVYLLIVALSIKALWRRQIHLGYSYWLFAIFLLSVWVYIRFFACGIPCNAQHIKYEFTPLTLLPFLTWADIVIWGGIAWLIILNIRMPYFQSSLKNKEGEKQKTSEGDKIISNDFIPDKPVKNREEDKLGYEDFVDKLASKISSLPVDKSFSIGIVASWGAGKSSFMNLLKETLGNEKYIIVEFNPRNSKLAKNIQEDFFSILCVSLSQYNWSLTSVFKRYMEALQIVSENKLLATFSLLNGWRDKETAKRDVENVLNDLPKKVVIFIEDLDRLLIEEILEVFKLIDENASFPNIIFVTAYDKTITEKMLREHMHIGNNSNFIDKFFDYEMILPIRPYRLIFSYLKKEILDRCGFRAEVPKVHEAIIDNVEYLFSLYITTMRDAKRFTNLFVSDYECVKGEVDFRDFLLVTILKYKSPEEHRRLYAEKRFLCKSPSQRIYLIKKDEEFENSHCYKSIINELFLNDINEEPENAYGRIFHVASFDIYFTIRIEGRLSQKEMNDVVRDNNFENVKNKVKEWSEEQREEGNKIKLIDYFIDYLSTRNVFKFSDKREFENYVKVALLVYSNYSDGYNMLLTLFWERNVNDWVSVYSYKDSEEYISFVVNCLREQPQCYSITQKLLINQIDNVYKDNPIILSRERLLEINKKYLNYYIKEQEIGEIHFHVFYSCIADINSENRKVLLESGSCEAMNEAILSSPGFYVERFVRLGMISSDPTRNSVACEPFWEQIFGNAEAFKEIFIKTPLHNELKHIVRLRNFWKLYEKNDYMPIVVEGEWDVQKIIENDLQELLEELNKAEKINSDFTALKTSRSPKSRQASVYNKLLNDIDGIKLHLIYVNNLKKDIQKNLNKLRTLNSDVHQYGQYGFGS